MKQHLLLIRTIMPDSTPSPRPSLIADLVDSVLKVPGMRVASVEVVEISAAETINRRIRKTGSEATSAQAPATSAPARPLEHKFDPGTSLSNAHICQACGGLATDSQHV